MLVKSIRGSIKYNGDVYLEGEQFEIESEHLQQVQENVEVISENDEKVSDEEKSDSNDTSEIDYKSLKKSELLELAKARGIEVPDKATNDKIIELLQGV